MDIHRSRFVPYPPSAINALAFSYAEGRDVGKKEPTDLRLAIGRANGDIELWNPAQGAWVHETTFRGGKDRSVEGLAWVQEPDEMDVGGNVSNGQLRLFSIGYSSTVTEWDLASGLPIRHSGGSHSEVWCLAAQPRWRAPKNKVDKDDKQANRAADDGVFRGQNLVAGCADGTLVLLSTADNDLRFQKFLSRPTAKKARVLSVAWQNRNVVVAGFADSTIRVFDTRNATLLRNITLGAAPVGGPRDILVWAVKCLPNGDIVSGDSAGEVRFYDGKTFSQLQRISGHEADILDLVTSADGRTVYSSGMDRRTVVYKLKTGAQKAKWAKVSHNRYHDHDVKAMTTYESRKMSVIVSGGVDASPTIIPLREYGQEQIRRLSGLPQSPPVTSAPDRRLVVSWWDREVLVWRMRRRGVAEKTHKLVARIALKGEENITSATVSRNGSLLAVSTAAAVKLFRLSPRRGEDVLRVRRLDSPGMFPGARLAEFSPDGKWLVVITSLNEVFVARLVSSAEKPGVQQIIPRLVELQRIPRSAAQDSALRSGRGSYDRIITRAQFSEDSTVLVTGDLAGYLDSWVLEGHEDLMAPKVDVADAASSASSAEDDDDDDDDDDDEKRAVIFLGQHWTRNPSGQLLPRLDSAPLILSFRPTGDDQKPQPNGNPAVHPTRRNPHAHSHELPHGAHRLVVLTAQHRLYEFDVLQGRLSDWSRRNPTSSLPTNFRGVRDRALGCVWHVTEQWQRLWVYGNSWLYMLDLSQDLSTAVLRGATNGGGAADAEQSLSNKRKRSSEQGMMSNTSGAGSRIANNHLLGLGRKMRRITGEQSEIIRLDKKPSQRDPDEEVSEDDAAGLFDARRALSEEVEVEAEGGSKPLKWWSTYKYRPILGLVPISSQAAKGDSKSKGGGAEALEVVLVERPAWDLDLPPRFVGSHER